MMHKTFLGFTLLETLVAISVLLMALLGPFAIASQALRSAYYARDQVTAFYLAQEGIEYVRALRDQNYLTTPGTPTNWVNGLDICKIGVGKCTVDLKTFNHAQCPGGVGGTCPVLYTDPSGVYTQSSGIGYTATKFTRSITITDVSLGGLIDEELVSVTVTWQTIGLTRSFTLKERIFNWL